MARYFVPPEEEEEEWNLSEETEEEIGKSLEEFQRLTDIEEFDLDNESAILGYFIKNLHRTKYQPSPINLRQFYLGKAVESLSQIKDTKTRKLLEDLVYSKTKH